MAELGPRTAATVAAAAEPMPPAPQVTLKSDGVLLIYGCDEQAIEVGNWLKDSLDVTVLMLPSASVIPTPAADFPVVRGVIRSIKGYLGAFDLIVDDFAQPTPTSDGTVMFGSARNGAVSRCDIVLDLSGGAALFPAPDLRDGYVRADPRDTSRLRDVVSKTRELRGIFDKPRYIAFVEQLCAHSRSQITGCTRCLDLCPAGAISPAGNTVAIDAYICAGCGQCAAACPTGAASYAVPPADALARKLRTLLSAYHGAGGLNAVILVRDEVHGSALVEMANPFGDQRESDAQSAPTSKMPGDPPPQEGLPDRIVPFAVNEVAQVGLDFIVAAFAFGASAVRFLVRARAGHDRSGLIATLELAQVILAGLGFGTGRIAVIEADDPDILMSTLRGIPVMDAVPRPSTLLPMGGEKRSMVRLILRELHRASPAPVDVIDLPSRAPFGSVDIDVAGCTLCLSCVSACPTGALADDADRPMLTFSENACIQCGLCQSTCPEKVVTLTPRLDFRAVAASPRVLKEEQPFCCIRCGKPFGVRSTIERVIAKLSGTHWMYGESHRRLDLIKMCDDCRVTVVSEDGFDPHARPRDAVRTTDDYLREREEQSRRSDDDPEP